MNKKNFMDMMICSLSAAIIIQCFTYMEQSRGRDTFTAFSGCGKRKKISDSDCISGISAAGGDGFSAD